MDADVTSASDRTVPGPLSDIQPSPIAAAWPFSMVEPGEFWALSEAQRRIIEQTVAAMIVAMRPNDDKV